MFRRNRKNLKTILGWTGGGVHKRIDENRELLELLQQDGFIDRYPWVKGWLRSQDEFLSELIEAVPIQEGGFVRLTPRPWPKKPHTETDRGSDRQG
jgi:hypothetical protein